MTSSVVKGWAMFIVLLLAVYASYSFYRVYQAAEATSTAGVGQATVDAAAESDGEASLDDFTFVDTDGQTFPLAKLKGQVWVEGFFFASCPGTCAVMNRSVAALANELKDKDVRFVSITVDPANDTPSVLKKYAESFGARPDQWTFLSGNFGDIERLGTDVFRVTVAEKTHTERLLLIDRDGQVQGTYNATVPAQMEMLKAEILKQLDSPRSEAVSVASADTGSSRLEAGGDEVHGAINDAHASAGEHSATHSSASVEPHEAGAP